MYFLGSTSNEDRPNFETNFNIRPHFSSLCAVVFSLSNLCLWYAIIFTKRQVFENLYCCLNCYIISVELHVSLSVFGIFLVYVQIFCFVIAACADAYLTPCIKKYVKGFSSGFKGGLKVRTIISSARLSQNIGSIFLVFPSLTSFVVFMT